MDETLFAKYLKDQGLAISSIKTYLGAIRSFLNRNPDIADSNSYHNFLVYSMRGKSMYANFYAMRLFIRYKFSDNATLRNQLLEDLETK